MVAAVGYNKISFTDVADNSSDTGDIAFWATKAMSAPEKTGTVLGSGGNLWPAAATTHTDDTDSVSFVFKNNMSEKD